MKILGLAGRAGVGKDYLANYLLNHLHATNLKAGKEAFAKPFKTFTEAVLSISSDGLETRKRMGKPEIILGGMTARRFMQLVGTEFGRKMNSDIWINSMINRLNNYYTYDTRIIITDVRFSNELAFINRFGGKVCRIFAEVEGSQYDHDSEALPFKSDFDFTNTKEEGSTDDFLHQLSVHYNSFLLP